MKTLWISPQGDGLAVADRIKEAGHQVVVYGEGGGRPLVQQQDLYKFAQLSDLIVIDSAFPVVRTRRSFRPHQDSLFFDELRRAYDFVALGPTPTVDLLCGDPRYLRKWCGRLNIPHGLAETGEPWSSGAWFKANEVIPEGPYLAVWKPLFKSVGFRGWFELTGVMTSDGPVVQHANATWDANTIPAGREAEFLSGLSG